MVEPARFELAISTLRGSRPRPLDDGSVNWLRWQVTLLHRHELTARRPCYLTTPDQEWWTVPAPPRRPLACKASALLTELTALTVTIGALRVTIAADKSYNGASQPSPTVSSAFSERRAQRLLQRGIELERPGRIELLVSSLARMGSTIELRQQLVGRGGIEPHAAEGTDLQSVDGTSLSLFSLPVFGSRGASRTLLN